jgi:hypothetical protein
MPAFLEKKLDKEHPNEPTAKYKIMNSLGVMKGNKETAKGRREEKKHDAKSRALTKKK